MQDNKPERCFWQQSEGGVFVLVLDTLSGNWTQENYLVERLLDPQNTDNH